MTYKGVVKGKVVVLEEGANLPDGTKVEVLLLDRPSGMLPDLDKRHTALNQLLSLQLPVADWEQMEEEIIMVRWGGMKML